MRPSDVLASLAATAFTGFFLVAVVLMAPDLAFANELNGAAPLAAPKLSTPCGCSSGEVATPASRAGQSAYIPQLDRTPLDIHDEVAALDAVRIALNEVGDGGSYVWQRHHGRLSGVVQPTGSFKDQSGLPCRHIVMMLTSTILSKKTEGIACRLPNGNWQLAG
jgi:surface antigen